LAAPPLILLYNGSSNGGRDHSSKSGNEIPSKGNTFADTAGQLDYAAPMKSGRAFRLAAAFSSVWIGEYSDIHGCLYYEIGKRTGICRRLGARAMDHAHRFDVLLAHEVDVSKVATFLLHQLDCDHWYVACHHENLFVYRLTKRAEDRYAVFF
jgi:hypothetical protein